LINDVNIAAGLYPDKLYGAVKKEAYLNLSGFISAVLKT